LTFVEEKRQKIEADRLSKQKAEEDRKKKLADDEAARKQKDLDQKVALEKKRLDEENKRKLELDAKSTKTPAELPKIDKSKQLVAEPAQGPPKDDSKKKLKKTKSDISDVPPTENKNVETPTPEISAKIEPTPDSKASEITKQQEPTEKPMSEFEKRRAEMQARRDAKQKELDAIKQGKFHTL
jgi:hypothetical protein